MHLHSHDGRRLLAFFALTCAILGLACGQARYPLGEVNPAGGGGAGARGGTGLGRGTGGETSAPAGGSGVGRGTTGPGGITGTAGSAGAGGAVVSADGSAAPPVCPIPSVPLEEHPIGLADSVLADRLSKFLWTTRADDTLVARVAALQPHSSSGVIALAREMASDARITAGIDALGRDWLLFDEAGASVPSAEVQADVTDALRASMAYESVRFFESMFQAGGATLSILLTAGYSFLDHNLAAIYGVTPPSQTGFALVTLDPHQRSGILTQPGFLFRKPHLATRGFWLRRVLLCDQQFLPPVDESREISSRPAGWSYRQALEANVSQASCAACHSSIDQAGDAFEHYDPLGRWRETDNGVAVDARGAIVALDVPGVVLTSDAAVNFSFDGAIELGSRLATSCYVHSCVAQRFLERALEGPLRSSELQSRDELARAFVASGLNLKELLVLTTGAGAFLGP
jgi:uncharacterized protein DUF1592/uncharacterized protein DUF1588